MSGPADGPSGPAGAASGPAGGPASAGTGRPLEVVRAAWGAACVLVPRRVAGLAGDAPDRRAVVVTRVLGARHLVQAAFTLRAPGPAVLAAGAWVDTVHAATAVVLAVVDRRRARSALVDAAVATAWAVLSRRDVARTEIVLAGGEPVWTERLARAVLPLLPLAPAAPLPDGRPGRR